MSDGKRVRGLRDVTFGGPVIVFDAVTEIIKRIEPCPVDYYTLISNKENRRRITKIERKSIIMIQS